MTCLSSILFPFCPFLSLPRPGCLALFACVVGMPEPLVDMGAVFGLVVGMPEPLVDMDTEIVQPPPPPQ